MKQKRKKQGKQEGKSQFYKNAASQVLYGHNAIWCRQCCYLSTDSDSMYASDDTAIHIRFPYEFTQYVNYG